LSGFRRYPIGAEVLDGGVHFRVWAPRRKSVDIVSNGGTGYSLSTARSAAVSDGAVPLEPEPGGYFSGFLLGIAAGALYRFRVDEGERLPDPTSRFQPQGPHGPSEIVDPAAFAWTHQAWRGLELPGQVIYEMHIGTFTREGTFEAVRRELPELERIGITAVELMPVPIFRGGLAGATMASGCSRLWLSTAAPTISAAS